MEKIGNLQLVLDLNCCRLCNYDRLRLLLILTINNVTITDFNFNNSLPKNFETQQL